MDFNKNIRGNLLYAHNITVDIKKLVSFLQSNTHITELSLCNCKIGEKGAEALAKLSHLTSLKLSMNNIGDKGAEALAKLSHLTSLDLVLNNIGEKGTEALANGNLSYLISLDLGLNNIGEKGAKALANGNLSYLTSLKLHGNKIGVEAIEALANGNLSHLTSLDLHSNKIGVEAIEALANGNLSHLTSLDLTCNNIGAEGIEALAKLQHRGVVLVGAEKIFYDFLSGVYSNKHTMNEENLKKVVFEVAQIGNDVYTIQSILTNPDKYRFLINSRDEQGHTLSHFYTYSPEMQKFLFERGLIPEQERNQRRDDERIAQDKQSVHDELVVKRTNFFTKKLVESIEVGKERLNQAVTSYVDNIPKLLEQYQNNQVKIGFLGLKENEKKSVMETVLNGDDVPNDKEFIKIVIDKAKDALEKQYLRKNQRGEFDQGYPTHRMQYDYTRDDAKVTIPESIGYVKLLIETFPIPLQERKELLVTLMEQNPDLVKNKLSKVKEKLGNNVILDKEQFNKTELHRLLNSIDDGKKVDELFKEISCLNIEEVWREQKEFILLKQIYIAATTYGENSSSCIQGTWTQIIDSIKEISSEIVAQYDRHLEEEQKLEAQKDAITKENIKPLLEDLANKLIQYVELNPELKETLEDFVMCIVDIDKPEEITFEQQKVLAEINEYFNRNIKGVLQNYDRNIPSKGEYSFIIEGLSEVVQLQGLFKLQENITGEMEAQIDEDSSDEWFDVEDNSNSYVTSSESDTDEEFKDASESISSEESNVLLVSERSQPENSVRALATDQKMVKFLMEKGDYFHEKKADKWTLLHLAAEDGRLEIVEFLLENRAKVDEKEANGLTPLHLAAQNGHTEIVKALIGKGADVNAVEEDKWTPLHLAARFGYKDVVTTLLDNGAKVDEKQVNEWTPLHLAAHNGYTEIVKALIGKGADVNAVKEDKWTPLHLAAHNGHTEIVKALIGKGADVNAVKEDKWTPLHLAAHNGHLDAMLYLLNKGADPLIKNKEGSTPRDLANNENIIQLLKKAETKHIIGKAVKAGSVCGVIAALAVGGGLFAAGVALPILDLIGIAVAVALVIGVIAGGITYLVSKPSDKLDEPDLEVSNQQVGEGIR